MYSSEGGFSSRSPDSSNWGAPLLPPTLLPAPRISSELGGEAAGRHLTGFPLPGAPLLTGSPHVARHLTPGSRDERRRHSAASRPPRWHGRRSPEQTTSRRPHQAPTGIRSFSRSATGPPAYTTAVSTGLLPGAQALSAHRAGSIHIDRAAGAFTHKEAACRLSLAPQPVRSVWRWFWPQTGLCGAALAIISPGRCSR